MQLGIRQWLYASLAVVGLTAFLVWLPAEARRVGGDLHYAGNSSTLVAMEILSALNGVIGMVGLTLWHRSRG